MSGDLVLKHDHIVIYMPSFMYNDRDKKKSNTKTRECITNSRFEFCNLGPITCIFVNLQYTFIVYNILVNDCSPRSMFLYCPYKIIQ